MSTIYGMDWDKGLTLLLHTPGGITNATETLVGYLRSKFGFIEVMVPALAMSAGTMIALGSDRIVMGRQSQLGPIDPQVPIPATGRSFSARSIVDQFEHARQEIHADRVNAHAWAPILSTLGHGLLEEAQNALQYGEDMVTGWLEAHMMRNASDPAAAARIVAAHFNDAAVHKSHGRRIDRDDARAQGVTVEDLEDSQALQEAVLSAYHVATIAFQTSTIAKFIASNRGRQWVKHWQQPTTG